MRMLCLDGIYIKAQDVVCILPGYRWTGSPQDGEEIPWGSRVFIRRRREPILVEGMSPDTIYKMIEEFLDQEPPAYEQEGHP